VTNSKVTASANKDERLWPQLANGAHGLGEHVALVHVSAVLSTHRKRLAGRSAGHDHHVALKGSVVEAAHIALVERPFLDVMRVMAFVLAKGFAGVGIPFDHGGVMKPRLGHPDGESPGAREEFNALHRETS
jgi:hypothetical protein